jgi:hypothetical protein
VHYTPRPVIPSKIDAFRPVIDARLAEFPRLTATRVFDEILHVLPLAEREMAGRAVVE